MVWQHWARNWQVKSLWTLLITTELHWQACSKITNYGTDLYMLCYVCQTGPEFVSKLFSIYHLVKSWRRGLVNQICSQNTRFWQKINRNVLSVTIHIQPQSYYQLSNKYWSQCLPHNHQVHCRKPGHCHKKTAYLPVHQYHS